MDSLTIGFLGIGALLFLIVVGVHIGFALILSGTLGLYMILQQSGPVMNTVVSGFYHKVTSPALVTVPLFVLMGFLASGGGISRSIYESLSLWFGKFKSGLGIATVFACTGFGTVCGSSLVTAAVFARISAPEMRNSGYDKKLAYGICASAGAIGMLIPPSILIVIYGILSGESIGKLLMAGITPGLLLTLFFSLTIIVVGWIKPVMLGDISKHTAVSLRQRLYSLKNWWSVGIVAFVMFGGIYGGVFSPSEAAAVAAFLLLVIYLSITVFSRTKRAGIKKELLGMFYETAITSAMIFFVMGGATVFSSFITLSGITAKLSAFITSSGMSEIVVVLIIVFFVLILGCFLDSTSILCITIPVFNPIINSMHIDPIWYATVIILAVEVGLITPPFGLNVFATKGVAQPDVELEDIFTGILPFLVAMMLALILLLAFPPISIFLPSFVE